MTDSKDLWGGRFREPLSEEVRRFTDFSSELWAPAVLHQLGRDAESGADRGTLGTHLTFQHPLLQPTFPTPPHFRTAPGAAPEVARPRRRGAAPASHRDQLVML